MTEKNCNKRCADVLNKDLGTWLTTIYECLYIHYGEQKPTLQFDNVFQLLIMIVLSAQESDAKINKVAKTFFAKYPDCHSIANASLRDLESSLKQIGLYKQKARWIKQLCTVLLNEYNGKIPQTIDELVRLPGIGRKTANAVLAYGFNIPAVVVDRHAARILARTGVFKHVASDTTKLELETKKHLDKRYWIQFSLLLQTHGRTLCRPQNPDCIHCPIKCCCNYGYRLSSVSNECRKLSEGG